MIYLKQTKVTEWIISGNPEQYNVVDAFHNLHRVDCKLSPLSRTFRISVVPIF